MDFLIKKYFFDTFFQVKLLKFNQNVDDIISMTNNILIIFSNDIFIFDIKENKILFKINSNIYITHIDKIKKLSHNKFIVSGRNNAFKQTVILLYNLIEDKINKTFFCQLINKFIINYNICIKSFLYHKNKIISLGNIFNIYNLINNKISLQVLIKSKSYYLNGLFLNTQIICIVNNNGKIEIMKIKKKLLLIQKYSLPLSYYKKLNNIEMLNLKNNDIILLCYQNIYLYSFQNNCITTIIKASDEFYNIIKMNNKIFVLNKYNIYSLNTKKGKLTKINIISHNFDKLLINHNNKKIIIRAEGKIVLLQFSRIKPLFKDLFVYLIIILLSYSFNFIWKTSFFIMYIVVNFILIMINWKYNFIDKIVYELKNNRIITFGLLIIADNIKNYFIFLFFLALLLWMPFILLLILILALYFLIKRKKYFLMKVINYIINNNNI